MKIKAAALAASLKKGPLPSLYAITGSEDFLKREATAQILETLHGGPPPAEDCVRITPGPSPSADDLAPLFDDLRTPSLFGGDRSIVVSGADKLLAADSDAWSRLLADGFSGATLILLLDGLDGRTKVAKAIAKAGWVIQAEKPFHRPPPWEASAPPWKNELNDWIVARARKHSLKLDPPTAHLLQTRVGTSLGDIASALERLATVRPDGGAVDADLVLEHTPDGEESNLFELVDVFFLADRARSLQLTREILHRGSVDSRGSRVTEGASLLLQFVGAAIRRARQLREIHRVQAEGGDDGEIMRSAGVARPFLPRLKQQARATSPPAIARVMRELRRADRDLKTGRGPRGDELLERVVARCGGSSGPRSARGSR